MKQRRRRMTIYIEPQSELLAAWVTAAAAWRELRSDPAEARCRAARAAYYQAVWGRVPTIRGETEEQARAG